MRIALGEIARPIVHMHWVFRRIIMYNRSPDETPNCFMMQLNTHFLLLQEITLAYQQ